MGFRRFGTARSVGSCVNAAPAAPTTPAQILTGMVLEMDANNIEAITGISVWYGNPEVGTPDVEQLDSSAWAGVSLSDASFNGQPVGVFSGNDALSAKYYESDALAGLSQGEVFAVLKCDYDGISGWPSGARTGLWTMNGTGTSTHYQWTDGHIYDGFGSTVRKDYGLLNTLPLRSPHIYNVSTAAGDYTARYNGSVIYTTASNTVGFPTLVRFGATSSATVVFNGRLAYLVVTSQVQTPTARAQMNTYLSQRFAITLS